MKEIFADVEAKSGRRTSRQMIYHILTLMKERGVVTSEDIPSKWIRNPQMWRLVE